MPQATLTLQVSYIPPPGSAPIFQPPHQPEVLPHNNPSVELDTVTSNEICPLFFHLLCVSIALFYILLSLNLSACAVISLDTLGEEDTESMIMLEPTEDQGPDDGRSMVIVGPQGPTGHESPTTQTPKRSPQSYNTHGGLRKRRRGASTQPKPLPNKPQDIQVHSKPGYLEIRDPTSNSLFQEVLFCLTKSMFPKKELHHYTFSINAGF